MNINNTKFELTAVRPNQYPSSSIPEVALVGRSNVGKSSFINTLVNRKGIARVGSTPGKTREINFYNIDDRLYLVDLPGYGFAGVSKGQKASWSEMIETYLNSRKQLSLIIMLVDIRHSPSADDMAMYEWLESSGISFIIAASKADKISRSQLHTRLKDIADTLGLPEGVKPIPFSAETRQGRDEILAAIMESTVEPAHEQPQER